VLHSQASFHADRVTASFRGARCSTRRHIVLALEPTGRRLCIETDDVRIERYVRTAYRALLGSGSPGTGALDYGRLFTARVPATVCFNGCALPDGRAEDGTQAPWWSSGGYLIDQFVWRSLARDGDWTSLYGCVFTFGGRAAFVAGPSGVGKTTLGLALAAAGASFCGDEMILIHRRTKQTTALRRALSIRTESLERLDDQRISDTVCRFAEPLGDETSGIVALDPSRLGPLPAPAPLRAVILAESGDGAARLVPVSTARAAARLTPYLTERPMDLTGVTDVAELIAGAAAFRLSIGAPRETAAALLDGIAAC
jgi:hypothetical protein